MGCRFCAFAQRRTDPDAYSLSLAEIGDRVREAVAAGATEICMQGGIDPDLPAGAYFDLARAVKAAAPGVHLHAFSPMEVMNGVARTGLPVAEFLAQAKAAGPATGPEGAATTSIGAVARGCSNVKAPHVRASGTTGCSFRHCTCAGRIARSFENPGASPGARSLALDRTL